MSSVHDTLKTIRSATVLQHFEANRDNEITDADEYVDLYHFAELVESRINDLTIQNAARELASVQKQSRRVLGDYTCDVREIVSFVSGQTLRVLVKIT